MRLYSWNVNGIRAIEKKGALKEFFESEKPDILCMQETKIDAIQLSKEKFEENYPDFFKIWSFADRKGYSGTAIWSKSKPMRAIFNFDKNTIETSSLADTYGDATREGRICAAEFADFWLLTVYTPNAKNQLERLDLRQKWDKTFANFAQKLESGQLSNDDFNTEEISIFEENTPSNFAKKPVIFCGDLNVAHQEIDLARPKQNRRSAGFTDEERAGISATISKGFIDTFRNFHPTTTDKYTWWSYLGGARKRNVGWRIDYFLASQSIFEAPNSGTKIIEAQIHDDILGSDHCPVSILVSSGEGSRDV